MSVQREESNPPAKTLEYGHPPQRAKRPWRWIVAGLAVLLVPIAFTPSDLWRSRAEIDDMTGSLRVRHGILWFNGTWSVRPSTFATEMTQRGKPVSPHWRFLSETTHGLTGTMYEDGASSVFYQYHMIPMQSMTDQESDQILKTAAAGDDAMLRSVLETISNRDFDSP